MTTSLIDDELIKLLLGIGIDRSALTDHAHFSRDLGLDSLDIADLIMQAEDHFGIRIPDDYWNKLQTVGQLKDFLAQEINPDEKSVTGSIVVKSV